MLYFETTCLIFEITCFFSSATRRPSYHYNRRRSAKQWRWRWRLGAAYSQYTASRASNARYKTRQNVFLEKSLKTFLLEKVNNLESRRQGKSPRSSFPLADKTILLVPAYLGLRYANCHVTSIHVVENH